MEENMERPPAEDAEGSKDAAPENVEQPNETEEVLQELRDLEAERVAAKKLEADRVAAEQTGAMLAEAEQAVAGLPEEGEDDGSEPLVDLGAVDAGEAAPAKSVKKRFNWRTIFKGGK